MAVSEQKSEAARVGSRQRLRLLAGVGEIICVLAILVAAGSWALSMANAGFRDHVLLGDAHQYAGLSITLTEVERQKLAQLLLVPTLLQCLAIGFGLLLFRGYRRGEIFTYAAAQRLKTIGWLLLAMVPADLILKYLLHRALEPRQGHGGFSLSLLDLDFSSLAFGLLALLIGLVLAEACKLADENRLFV